MAINNPELRPAHRGVLSFFLSREHSLSFPGQAKGPETGARDDAATHAAQQETPAQITAPDQRNRLRTTDRHSGATAGSPLGGWPKRCMDIVIATIALVLAAPIMLIVASLIRMTTGGPAIFSHRRIGFNGQAFECYKFRTMVPDAEQALMRHLTGNPEAAREWQENRKLKRDPRITLLGQILRKSSLDELPQLFNILRGEMSCVGPRPVVADEVERYGVHASDYLRTRPGLTGLWQVTGRSSSEYSRRVELDAHYVRNWSVGFDLIILFRTVFAVLKFDDAS
ncbi:MAG: sugar transferase [Phyllobacterium sp.]